MSNNEMIPATNYTALKDFNLAEAIAGPPLRVIFRDFKKGISSPATEVTSWQM